MSGGGSIAFHGTFVGLAVLVAALKREPPAAPIEAPMSRVDQWTGVTSMVGGERLVDVNVDALGGQPAPAAPAAPPAPPSLPAAPPSPPRVVVAAAPALKPAVEKPALPDDPDGSEPAPKPRVKKAKPAAIDPAATSSAVAPATNAEPAPPASPRVAKRKGGAATGEGGDSAAVGPFGAEGPSAVRSLGRAFAHAIPAACQADPGWGTLPAGDAGEIEVALSVDATGHITGYEPRSSHPSKQLVALMKRTIALIDSGTFELKGSVGAGVEVLRIHAALSDVEVTAAGVPVAFGFGEGLSWFTQESGRHVEVTLRVVKLEIPSEP